MSTENKEIQEIKDFADMLGIDQYRVLYIFLRHGKGWMYKNCLKTLRLLKRFMKNRTMSKHQMINFFSDALADPELEFLDMSEYEGDSNIIKLSDFKKQSATIS